MKALEVYYGESDNPNYPEAYTLFEKLYNEINTIVKISFRSRNIAMTLQVSAYISWDI